MDNNEKDIFVGREYENAFNSICQLVNNNCIDKDIVSEVSLERREIKEAGTNRIYRYNSRIQSIDNGNAVGMVEDGASWFTSFRNGEIDDGNASWMNLIERVAVNYHKKYSFVEFQQKEEDIDEEVKEVQKEIAARFTKQFLPNLSDFSIEENKNIEKDDIYGVSMKIEIDGGTGEAEPVLCKVYFRNRNNILYPLSSEEASEIEKNLYQIIQSDSGEQIIKEENGETIDLVLNAVETIIDKGQFCNSIIYSAVDDEVIINKLLEKSPNDITELKCRNVNVFGISHVEWKNTAYVLTQNNKNILRFTFSMNNRFSVFCMNCGDELLLESNRFIMKEGNVELKLLDSEKEDFGYSQKDMDEVKNKAIISQHIIKVGCSSNELLRGNKTCNKIRCANQVQVFTGSYGEVVKCKDCPYPEIISKDEQGRLCLTKDLTFVRDMMQLVSNEVEHTHCKCCGRPFTMESIKKGLCPFCFDVENIKEGDQKAEKAKELYKSYSKMFSLTKRIRYAFSNKYCFEDEGIIIFRMGHSKYIFDKMNIKFNGLMSGPKKIK